MAEIDRRKFITRGVAGTAVAASASMWSPPTVMRTVSAVGATGTVQASSCYKYQYVFGSPPVRYNGVGYPTLVDYMNARFPGADLGWGGECLSSNTSTPRLAGDRPTASSASDRYNAWQTSVNKNCCIWQKEGNTVAWYNGLADFTEAIPTFPAPGCIRLTPTCDANEDGFNNNESVQFDIDTCGAGCRFADPLLWYVWGNIVDGVLVPTDAKFSQSTTSNFYDRVTWVFDTENNSYKFWPVSYMTWVLCDVSTDNTQNPWTACTYTAPGDLSVTVKA